MKKRTKTILITVVATLVIAGIGPVIFTTTKSRSTPTMVRLARPERGMLIEVVNAPGLIEPREKVEIRSRISAKVVGLPHKEGDWVVMGDANHNPPVEPSLLIELDSKDVRASLEAAQIRREARASRLVASRADLEGRRAGVEGQRAVLAQAEKELRRKKTLLKSQDVSQSDVDRQQSTVDNLRAQLIVSEKGLTSTELNLVAAQRDLEAADADIVQIRERVEYARIVSPMDGTLIKLDAEVGEMATGSTYNPGNVLAVVADLSQMLLIARVDETDIGRVEEGQKANVNIHAWPDRVFEGEVVTTALSQTQWPNGEKFFEVEVLLDNKDGEIYSGLNADVDIEVNTHEKVLKVPSQAVADHEIDLLPGDIREDSPEVDSAKVLAPVVYRYIDGRAHVTPIAFGASDATHTIVTSGVTADDEIIVGPYKALEGLGHLQKVKKEEDMSEEEAQAHRDKLGRKEPESPFMMR